MVYNLGNVVISTKQQILHGNFDRLMRHFCPTRNDLLWLYLSRLSIYGFPFQTSLLPQSLHMYKYIIGIRRYKFKCIVDTQCPVPEILLRIKLYLKIFNKIVLFDFHYKSQIPLIFHAALNILMQTQGNTLNLSFSP